MVDAHTIRVPFTSSSDCLLVPPTERGAGRPPLLVVLHGQGQSGARQRRWMEPAVPPHFAAAFPDGFHPHEVRRPDRPIRAGYGWYIYTGDRDALVQSFVEAESRLLDVVDAALAELDADRGRVWLAGFSQGAYLTHTTALHHGSRVRGWIGQCGGLRKAYLRDPDLDAGGRPVLLQHGRQDEAVPLSVAEEAVQILRAAGAAPELVVYDGGHVIDKAMAADARAWLASHEPPT